MVSSFLALIVLSILAGDRTKSRHPMLMGVVYALLCTELFRYKPSGVYGVIANNHLNPRGNLGIGDMVNRKSLAHRETLCVLCH